MSLWFSMYRGEMLVIRIFVSPLLMKIGTRLQMT